MITPLMHILSCLNEDYVIEEPVDIFYLNKVNRDFIIDEARRLGSYFSDDNKLWITDSITGRRMVSDVQVISGFSRELNPYTALLLTRVWKCFEKYQYEVNVSSTDTNVTEDLSTDAIVLRLEGNPKYIYVHVYNIMETPSLSYDTKIARLADLLTIIRGHSVIKDTQVGNARLLKRIELQSNLNYWKGMLFSDYIEMYGITPPNFSEDTISTICDELTDLGFYGFVNPLEMYQQFSSACVSRKIEVSISEEVIDFLTKIVLSGGATVE